MNLNQLHEFKIGVDRWPTYVSRLRAWFDIHDVKPSEYSKYLVAVVGTEPLDLIIDLCYPEKPEKVSFESIVKLVEGHLAPKRSIIAERMIFRACKQTESQSVSDYLAQLKKLSKACAFGTTPILKENLRDQFVFGLRSDKIRQRLLTEQDLTFDTAAELALSLEAAVRDSQEAKPEVLIEHGDTVHKIGGIGTGISGARKWRRDHRDAMWGGDGAARRGGGSGTGGGPAGINGGRRRTPPRYKCFRCGQSHKADKCPFISVQCFVCGIRGHVAKVCRSRNKGGVHNLVDDEVSSLSSAEEVFKLSDKEIDKKWLFKVMINGVPITMEGDTGASISIINKSLYEKYFSHIRLDRHKSNLKMYNGQTVKPRGEIKCSVQLNKKTIHDLQLVVIDNKNSNALFGRKWMRAFGISFPSIPCQPISQINEGNLRVKNAIKQLESKFPEVFSSGIGAFNKGKINLELIPNAVPVWRRARPVPYALRPAVEAELARLEREGIITPIEWSEWGTPVVPVIKKSGEVRLCGDFKTTLNPVLVDDKYPLPRIEDIFASLQGGRVFNKIDLSRAYQQLVLSDEAKKYCTIVTSRGMYSYNRLPFGIKCAASKFQRVMEKLFRLPNVVVYQDDLLTSSNTEEESLMILNKVFKILSECGLKIEKKKCGFFQKSVSYLGYIIDETGLKTDISKIDAVNRTPEPKNVSELKAFLGLVNYYGKFVRNLSNILEPLHKLLRNNREFIWSSECRVAFKCIKKALSNAPILARWDPSLPTFVTCDASPHGVGAVLAQRARDGQLRPVLHVSRTLTPAERNYSQICREGLAIIYAVNKFHDYLYGNKFTLVTDCKPLASIFSENKQIPSMAGNRLQRWAIILSSYNYQVKCIGSKQNCVADSLSRLPVDDNTKEYRSESYINFITEQAPIDYKIIAKHTAKDAVLQKLIHSINCNWLYCNEDDLKPFFNIKQYLNVESGCILFGHRVIIPQSLRDAILKLLHSCHQGIVKCKSIARGYVYWPGIDADIERECLSCNVCATTRPSPPQAPIHPWAWPQDPWYRLHVDFFSLGSLTYLVLVDAHSKWIEVHNLNSTSAKITIAKLRQIFSQFGLPHELVSDNGPPFGSSEFKAFMGSCGIKHILVSPYKPSSNGAAEVSVKISKHCLKKALIEKIDLKCALDRFLLSYRSTPHSLTGKSPAELLLGRKIRTSFDILRPDINKIVQDRQQIMKNYKYGKERYFTIGEKVLFKRFKNNKFSWDRGIISKCLGPVSYLIIKGDRTFKKHVDHIISKHHQNSGSRIGTSERGKGIDKTNSNTDICDFNILPYGTANPSGSSHQGCTSADDASSSKECEPSYPSAEHTHGEPERPRRARKQVDRYQAI